MAVVRAAAEVVAGQVGLGVGDLCAPVMCALRHGIREGAVTVVRAATEVVAGQVWRWRRLFLFIAAQCTISQLDRVRVRVPPEHISHPSDVTRCVDNTVYGCVANLESTCI